MRGALIGLVAVACAGAACGKKGPPLAPYVHIPAAVTEITAERLGDDVFVTLTLPDRNIDASQPVSLERVDVWAYTGRSAPARQRWAELGTLVERVDLPRTVDATEPPISTDSTRRRLGVVDRLGAAAFEPPPALAGAAPGGAVILRRFYVAMPSGPKDRTGPPGTVADVDLGPRPGPPAAVALDYDQSVITVTWVPPLEGAAFRAARAAMERDNPDAAVFADAADTESSPWRYNVYRAGEPVTPVAGQADSGVIRPRPVNSSPQEDTTLTIPVVFGQETCVTVRAVHGTAGSRVEGAATDEACITPDDIFPPEPPRQLAALPSADAIDLIWEPNDEPDLAGYLVLRGIAPDGPLQRLTASPIAATRYRDAAVTPGVKYFYSVVAVDNHVPEPNISAESNRVEDEPR
ncbi:MAG: fibronectin type III domain-containing protein [Vicinamibacterales bacterium]|nr:fibronectin type III domain-containing protein [Vicinamibacterales bacterium]